MFVFLSYRQDSPDTPFVRQVASGLAAKGHAADFAETLPAGTRWPEELDKWLERAHAFVVVLSTHSVQSDFVRAETKRAYERWKQQHGQTPIILPIRLDFDGGQVPLDIAFIDQFQTLKGDYDDSFFVTTVVDRICNSLSSVANRHAQTISGTDPAVTHISEGTKGTKAGRGIRRLGALLLVGVLAAAIVIWSAFQYLNILGQISGRRTPIWRIATTDSSQKRATLTFILVAARHPWRVADSMCVDDEMSSSVDSSLLSRCRSGVDVIQYVHNQEISESVIGLDDVIGIGLASCRGLVRDEGPRAIDRAQNLAAGLQEIANPHTSIWTLNLGQYQRTCEDKYEERRQRVILVVGVADKDPEVNIPEVLKKELYNSRLSIFGSNDPQYYANWSDELFKSALSLKRKGLTRSQ